MHNMVEEFIYLKLILKTKIMKNMKMKLILIIACSIIASISLSAQDINLISLKAKIDSINKTETVINGAGPKISSLEIEMFKSEL